jgi:hypothetical protein
MLRSLNLRMILDRNRYCVLKRELGRRLRESHAGQDCGGAGKFTNSQ